jgi:lysophospholipase L1-like esterase
VFVLAGTNDVLEGRDPAAIVRDIAGILDILATGSPSPQIVVTLVPAVRTGDKPGSVSELNQSLRQLCQERHIEVVDLNSEIAPHGALLPKFTTDGVHLSEAAYDIWTARLRSVPWRQPRAR